MLVRGARCEITGLVAAAQYNGTRCTLTEFHEAIGRWEVQLDGGTALRVKPCSLLPVSEALLPASGDLVELTFSRLQPSPVPKTFLANLFAEHRNLSTIDCSAQHTVSFPV